MKGALVTALLWTGCMTGVTGAELAASDYTEIQQLYARYNQAIDKGDADAWADTFTADGKFLNYEGREALKIFINSWRTNPQMNGPARRHFSADLVITPSADGATGVVSAMLRPRLHRLRARRTCCGRAPGRRPAPMPCRPVPSR
jgi:hypothetical protein